MTKNPTQSAAWWTAFNRAAMRGDDDRVCELMAVPINERADWKPRKRRRDYAQPGSVDLNAGFWGAA